MNETPKVNPLVSSKGQRPESFDDSQAQAHTQSILNPTPPKPESEKLTFGDKFKMSTDLDWYGKNNTSGGKTWKVDNWLPSTQEIGDWRVGLDERYWDGINKAVSKEHAAAIRQQAVTHQETEARLYEDGIASGTAARLLANMLDPTILAATIASEGLLAPLILTKKVGTMANVFRHAGLAMASTAAGEALLAKDNFTYETSDFMWAMAGAGTLGAMFSPLGKNGTAPEVRKLNASTVKSLRQIQREILLQDVGDGAGVIDLTVRQQMISDEVKQLRNNTLTDEQYRKTLNESSEARGKYAALADKATAVEARIKRAKERGTKRAKKGPGNVKQALAQLKRIDAEMKSLYQVVGPADQMLKQHEDTMSILDGIRSGSLPEALEAKVSKATVDLSARKTRSIQLAKAQKQLENQTITPEVFANMKRTIIGTEEAVVSGKVVDVDAEVSTGELDLSERVKEIFREADRDINNLRGDGGKIRRYTSHTRNAFIGTSDNPYSLILKRVLMEDGADTAGEVLRETAELAKQRIYGRFNLEFAKAHERNYKAWLKQKGVNPALSAYRVKLREEFNELVTLTQHGMQDDPFATQMGKDIEKLYEEFAVLLKDPSEGTNSTVSVSLMEEDADLSDYKHPRIYDVGKIDGLAKKLGRGNFLRGVEEVKMRFSDALTGIEDEAVRFRIASHVIDAVRKSRYHSGFDFDGLLRLETSDEISKYLTDMTAMTKREVFAFVEDLTKMRDAKKAESGKSPRLKERLKVDYKAPFFMDMIEKNSEKLFMGYINKMGGQVALAKNGIKSESEFMELLGKVQEYSRDVLEPEKGGLYNVGAQTTGELKIFEHTYKAITGQPVDTTSPIGQSISRVISAWGYKRLMGMMGANQIQEISTVTAEAGFVTMLRQLPAFRSLSDQIRDGDQKMVDDLLEELQVATGGFGADRMMHQPGARLDPETGLEMPKGQKFGEYAEAYLGLAGRAMNDYSLFSSIDVMLKNLAMRSLSQKFFDMKDMNVEDAFKNTIFKAKGERLQILGLSEENFPAIQAQMKAHAETYSSGRIKRLNLEAWDDPDAQSNFITAMQRSQNRAVMNVNIGDRIHYGTGTMMGAEGSVGRLLNQFLSFVQAAGDRVGWGEARHKDLFMGYKWALISLMAGLTYMGTTRINNLGKPDEKKRNKEQLSLERVAIATFQRSSFVGMSPMIMGPVMQALGSESWQAASRSSGLPSNALTGLAAVDLFDKIAKTGEGIIDAVHPERDMTQGQVKAMAALVDNSMYMRWFMNHISQDFQKQRDK